MENPEIHKACMSLIYKKMEQVVSDEEYYVGLLELDKAFPMKGHFPPLSKESYENYQGLGIQPKSFKEAAEMFIRGKTKKREILPDFVQKNVKKSKDNRWRKE